MILLPAFSHIDIAFTISPVWFAYVSPIHRSRCPCQAVPSVETKSGDAKEGIVAIHMSDPQT